MKQSIWFGIGGVALLVTLLFSPLAAQGPGEDGPASGPVGSTDDDTDDMETPDVEKFTPYPGPLGRVDDRLPHGACSTCFTVPGLGDNGQYQIFEALTVNDEEILIQRMIPNPSSAVVNDEDAETYDEELDEKVWYIGDQAYVGPTDTERWADTAPLATIALKRIQFKHRASIMNIPGVHRFGIGTHGFVVGLDPTQASNSEKIPLSLDGVSVTVELEGRATAAAHHTTRFRPVPVGAGIGVKVYTLNNQQYAFKGTIGPTVVRNRSNIGTCCQLWSLTAAHVVKEYPHSENPAPGTQAVYQPWGQWSKADQIGTIAHTFRLWPCSTTIDPFCSRVSTRRNPVVVNNTLTRPDIAAIDYDPFGNYQSALRDPEGKNPIRHLQMSATRSVDGPAGKIFRARRNHKHQMWGSHTPGGPVGKVRAVNEEVNVRMGRGSYLTYRVCCLNRLEVPGIQGDSGALERVRDFGTSPQPTV